MAHGVLQEVFAPSSPISQVYLIVNREADLLRSAAFYGGFAFAVVGDVEHRFDVGAALKNCEAFIDNYALCTFLSGVHSAVVDAAQK